MFDGSTFSAGAAGAAASAGASAAGSGVLSAGAAGAAPPPPPRAAARISSTLIAPSAVGVAAGASSFAGAALAAGSSFAGAALAAGFFSLAGAAAASSFSSGSSMTFKKSTAMSYHPMLLYASNSTSARPLILTVRTTPVMPSNRRNSGCSTSTTTYLSVNSRFRFSTCSNTTTIISQKNKA